MFDKRAIRGSCGVRPAHSIPGYELAIEQGADIIECDLAVTQDLVLLCLHDEFLSTVTNVSEVAEFADRKRRIGTRTDWWTIDFTLEEIKRLGLIQERSVRDPSFNNQFQIPTFEEYINVAQSASRTIGIYPETKKPRWFEDNLMQDYNITFNMETQAVNVLTQYGYTGKTDPCFLQSFEFSSLEQLHEITNLPLIFLFNTGSLTGNLDIENPNSNSESYDWLTWSFWSNISDICYGIGPSKTMIGVNQNGRLQFISNMVDAAHHHNVGVHPYTFRNEDEHLLWDYEMDPYREYELFYNITIDGYFTDFPGSLHKFMKQLPITTATTTTPTTATESSSTTSGTGPSNIAFLLTICMLCIHILFK